MQLPPYMTIEEFREWSRLGRTKIYELLGSGEILAIKVGRRTLISTESAEAWFGSRPVFQPTVGQDEAAQP